MKASSYWFTCLIFIPLSSWSGRVRNLPTNSKSMSVIQLTTGRSTVLRFQSPPKKVVLGNQNYFSVEFIDSDVTIQPQGVASSNMFVYGDGYTYGFILNVRPGSDYDDLVFIQSRIPIVALPRRLSQKTEVEESLKPDLKYDLISKQKTSIGLRSTPFRWSNEISSYYSDIFITLQSGSEVTSKMLELRIAGGKVNRDIAPVFEDDILKSNKTSRVRIFSTLEQRNDLFLNMKLMKQELKFELKWKK